MRKVPWGDPACEEIRRHLNSDLSQKAVLETNQTVLRHLETCPVCSVEWKARTRLRGQLKAAVERQPVPPDLSVRIRERIRSGPSPARWQPGWNRWAVALAASLAVCLGVWLNVSRGHRPALSDRPGQEAYIQRISAALHPILKVGLGDHIHCSVFRQYPRHPPTVAEMEEKLGPSYQGLLPLVKAAIPDGYRVILAHQCGYAGRRYIHVTLQNGTSLISLVITRKQPGESFSGLSPALPSSEIPVYQSAAHRYEVASFDAGSYLAFVVSELRDPMNLQIAAQLAPTVHEFLAKRPA
jgi:hypothetical protein